MSTTSWENRLQSVAEVRDFHVAWFARVREQVQSGEPFAICNGDEIEEVLGLLRVPALIMNNWNSEIIAQGGKAYYEEVLSSRGYAGPHRFAYGLASALDPSRAPWGGLPRPTVIVTGGKFEMELRVTELWARQFQCPLYAMDFMFSPPFKALPERWWDHLRTDWDQMIDPHRLSLRVQQEKDFIRFMERETGRTFGYDDLVRALNLVNEQMDLWRAAQALIAQSRPCPVSVRDQMGVYQAMWHRGQTTGVDMIRSYLDEIRQRVAEGVAAHPGERFRLYFNGRVPPWHEQIARKYGAVTVACSFTSIPDLYARDMKGGDPFGAMASRHVFLFAQDAERMLAVAQEHQCDAVVVIEPKMRPGVPSIEQRTVEAAGLPYLALPRDTDDAEVMALLSQFIETRLGGGG